MLILLSPAKTLDLDTPTRIPYPTQPRFLHEAASLARTARRQSAEQLGELMSVSPALATLNRSRFQNWSIEHDAIGARPAIQAFRGDVYAGLDADSFDAKDLEFAQAHLRILSGLYGVLRPLDLMHAYRLEMGTRLVTRRGRTLYDYWGNRVARALDEDAAGAPIVNLASNEYFSVVRRAGTDAPIITPVFEDQKNDGYKVISFFAKRARGAMARHLVQVRATTPEAIDSFRGLGYRYLEADSTEARPVFRRSELAAQPYLAKAA